MDPRNELLYAVRQDETDKKTEEGATLDTVIFSFVEELDSRLLVAVLVYVYLSSFNTRKQSKPVVRKVSSNNSNTTSLVLMAASSVVRSEMLMTTLPWFSCGSVGSDTEETGWTISGIPVARNRVRPGSIHCINNQ